MSITITHNKLKDITIEPSRRAKRIIFKVKNGILTMVVPVTMPCNKKFLLDTIDNNLEGLQRLMDRTRQRYSDCHLYDGKVIATEECEIVIRSDASLKSNSIQATRHNNLISIGYHPDIDITSTVAARYISRLLLRYLGAQYGEVLKQLVRDNARRLGLTIAQVTVGHSRRTWGHCSAGGNITISETVLLLPHHLRQYIVCHELAHLTHFNHSREFHQLCNQYCDGNEAIWRKEVAQIALPVCL